MGHHCDIADVPVIGAGASGAAARRARVICFDEGVDLCGQSAAGAAAFPVGVGGGHGLI